jgi:hypothetical protein
VWLFFSKIGNRGESLGGEVKSGHISATFYTDGLFMKTIAAMLMVSLAVLSCKKEEAAALTPIGKWKLDDPSDVVYLEVTNDSLFIYDYLGDAYDDIADCYFLDSIEYSYEEPWMTIEGDAWYTTLPDERMVLTLRTRGVNEKMSFLKAAFNPADFKANVCSEDALGQAKTRPFVFGHK